MLDAREQKIADILAEFGEPYAPNVWKIQGTPVIYHACLERIAARAGIVWEKPEPWRSETADVAIYVAGKRGERLEWSIGEARIGEGGNYRVSGKQAGYPWAMAEKRGKDRVILKLIQLSGLAYSDVEAEEFRADRADPEPQADTKPAETPYSKAIAGIGKGATWQAIERFMQKKEVQDALNGMSEDDRTAVRFEAVRRMKELGWKNDKADLGEFILYETPFEDLPKYLIAHLKRLDPKTKAATKDAVDDFLEEKRIVWEELSAEIKGAVNETEITFAKPLPAG